MKRVTVFCAWLMLLSQVKADNELTHVGTPQNENNDIGEKEFYEGFGFPEKQFLSKEELPAEIFNVAKASLRRLCVCKVGFDSCATVFCIGKEKFMTNEHVVQSLERQIDYYFPKQSTLSYVGLDEKKKSPVKCDFEFAILGENETWTKVDPIFLKRGKTDPKGGGGLGHWDPKKYYSVKTEDFSNNTDDMALMELRGITATPLEIESNMTLGQKLYFAGFSGGQAVPKSEEKSYVPQISEGAIQSIKQYNVEADFLGVPGMSGGPVLNEHGKVVGVFWGKEATWRDRSPFFTKARAAEEREFFKFNGYPRERSFFIPAEFVKSFLK